MPNSLCRCNPSLSYCQAVFGRDQSIIDNLGCGYANGLAQFFEIRLDEKEAFFKRAWTRPFQTKPLVLKSSLVELEVARHIELSERSIKQIGRKSRAKKNIIQKKLDLVHEALRIRINNYKNNGVLHCLRHHLYMIMPESEGQRQYLPSIDILVDNQHQVKLFFACRTKERPYKAQRTQQTILDHLNSQIEVFKQVMAMAKSKEVDKLVEGGKVAGVLHSFAHRIEGTNEAIDDDLGELLRIKLVLDRHEDIVVGRSQHQVDMMELLRGNKINRRIAGPIMIDQIRREFQVQVGGCKETIYVHPRHVDSNKQIVKIMTVCTTVPQGFE